MTGVMLASGGGRLPVPVCQGEGLRLKWLASMTGRFCANMVCAAVALCSSGAAACVNEKLSGSPVSRAKTWMRKCGLCCPAAPPFAMKTVEPVLTRACCMAARMRGIFPKRWVKSAGGRKGRMG